MFATLQRQLIYYPEVAPETTLLDTANQIGMQAWRNASDHFPMLPIRALLTERYESLNALGRYEGPVAFLIAAKDEIVPAVLGRKLYDSYGGPKWLCEQPGAGHNTLDFDPASPWWQEVTTFWLSR